MTPSRAKRIGRYKTISLSEQLLEKVSNLISLSPVEMETIQKEALCSETSGNTRWWVLRTKLLQLAICK